MQIFRINDCDWWIGGSLNACISDYIANYGGEEHVDDDAGALTEAELDSLIFTDIDGSENGPPIKRTFREQLAIEIAAGGQFPRIFATTEF